jgi:hypothetical protein
VKEGIEWQSGWRRGSGAIVLLLISLPLYREFSEPKQTVWNVSLAIFLAAVVVAALLLQLYFVGHANEIGEARFDTRNKDGADG